MGLKMHVYIDEAGTFIIPTQKTNYLSSVVALIIPSETRESLFDSYIQLRTSWGSKDTEIKGSKLNEQQIAKVIRILTKHEAIAQVFAIGGTHQTEQSITDFKIQQANNIMEHVGPKHPPALVESLLELRERIRSTPNQLFVQAFLTTCLCEEVIRMGTLYWSQRVPKELGHFTWIVDAKDKTITQAEDLWHTLVKPFVESSTMAQPLVFVKDPRFDYSYLEQHAVDEAQGGWKEKFEWLKEVDVLPADKPAGGIDLKPIFSDLRFANSQSEVGLQLADIVASAFHRACKGTLQKTGWRDLGVLFIKFGDIVHLVALGSGDKIELTDPQLRDVITTIRRDARSLFSE